jgi:hypothetical protein
VTLRTTGSSERTRSTTRPGGSSVVPEPRRRHGKLRALAFLALGAITGAVVAGRALAPELIRNQVQDALFQVDDAHAGSVASVELSLLRGRVALRELALWPVGSEKPTLTVPVAFAQVDLARSLRERKLIARATVNRPSIYIRDDEFAPKPADEVPHAPPALPVAIDQVVVNDGTLLFRTRRAKQPVDIRLEQLSAIVDGIELDRTTGEVLPRSVRLRGVLLESGKLDVRVVTRADGTILADASLEDLDLSRLNPTIIAAAGGLEVKRGSLDLYVSATITDRRYIRARVRPFVTDLEPATPRGDESFARRVVASIGKTVADVLEDRRDTIASDFEIEGVVEDPGVPILQIVTSVLQNAFLQELARGTRVPLTTRR